jgi:hypothetical protein
MSEDEEFQNKYGLKKIDNKKYNQQKDNKK